YVLPWRTIVCCTFASFFCAASNASFCNPVRSRISSTALAAMANFAPPTENRITVSPEGGRNRLSFLDRVMFMRHLHARTPEQKAPAFRLPEKCRRSATLHRPRRRESLRHSFRRSPTWLRLEQSHSRLHP